MNRTLIIVIGIVVVTGAILLLWPDAPAPSNTAPVNATNQDATNQAATNASLANTPTNASSLATNTAQDVIGTVFLKGYDTPSESYGILVSQGREIGMGDYDTMMEELRPYIGERISVTFASICKSNQPDCCRTLFAYCGNVTSWEPIETD